MRHDDFYIDRRPILLCEPLARATPKGDLQLYAVMETAHLQAARTATIKKLAPRPDFFALYAAGFDPHGTEGQRCRLEMRAVKEYAGKGGPKSPAPKSGSRERRLGRLRQKIHRKSGESYLFGLITSKVLTHVLRELADTAGGTLERVGVIIRRTPRFGERWPEWTVFLALPT